MKIRIKQRVSIACIDCLDKYHAEIESHKSVLVNFVTYCLCGWNNHNLEE